MFPVRVEGPSMLPALRPGDLLAARPPRANEPKRGQIVLVRTAERELVKRVARATADEVEIAGDNAGVSHGDGVYARADVVGVVRFRYWPLWRARRFK